MAAPPPAKRKRKLTLAVPPKEPDRLAEAEVIRAQLVTALEQVTFIAEKVGPMIEALATADELDALLDLLGRFVDARATIDGMQTDVSKAAMTIAPDAREKYPIPGGGTFRIASGAKKKVIDHAGVQADLTDALVREGRVASLVTVDGEIGEITPWLQQVVVTVCKATGASVPSFTGWRTNVLKELKVSLSKHTDWEDGPEKPVIEDR